MVPTAVASVLGITDDKKKKQLEDVWKKGAPMSRGLRKEFTTEKIAELRMLGLSEEDQEKFGIAGGVGMGEIEDLLKMNRETRDAAIEQRRAEEQNAPVEKRFMTNLLGNTDPENYEEALERQLKSLRDAALKAQLLAAGITEDMAQGITTAVFERGVVSEEQGKVLKAMRGTGLEESPFLKPIYSTLQDFIWRPGQAPVRINEGDVLTGAKAGGPIARAGGGASGQVVNVHMYGNADGFRSNRAKIARVMAGRT